MKQFWYRAGWIALIALLLWLDLRGSNSVLDLWYDAVWTILVVLLLWPAHPGASDMFAPKSKSWVERLLSPVRDIHRRVAPRDPLLLRATRRWLFAALIAAWALRLSRTQVPGLAQFPFWPVIECGVTGLIVARAITFWMADRRSKSPKERVSA
jgi:hypothetical protein